MSSEPVMPSEPSKPIAYWIAAEQARTKRLLPVIALMFIAVFASLALVATMSHRVAWLDPPQDPDALAWKHMAALVLAGFGPMVSAGWILGILDTRTAIMCPQCEAAMINASLRQVCKTRQCPHCAGSIVTGRRPARPDALERHRAIRDRQITKSVVDGLLVSLVPLQVFATWNGIGILTLSFAIPALYAAVRLGRPSRIIFAACLMVAPCWHLGTLVPTG
ncbi:MAG: hypothetical protein AB8G96_16300 [Phycisphaerales bacterium]